MYGKMQGHLSINKRVSKSGDLKLAGRDGKWENGLVADTCLTQEACKIYYLANLTAPWCAVYLET